MRVLLIGLLIIFVGGCYNKETISTSVLVRKTSKPKYEIQIKKHIEGRGNIHTLSLSKYEYDNSDWIYVNSLEGKISAKDIVFSHYWACIEYPWSISNLRT